jgi:sigma-E factor negative regulatory protein RseB
VSPGVALAALPELTVDALFEYISQSRKQLDFRGVILYSRGDEMNSLKVVHRFVNGEEQERLVVMDGMQREILRRGDLLLCILPGSSEVLLSPDIPGASFTTTFLPVGAEVGIHYEVSLVGIERQAGFPAQKILVMAKDEYRYSHMLWLEKDSGLLMKSVTADASGKPLERFQFTELSLHPDFEEKEFDGIQTLTLQQHPDPASTVNIRASAAATDGNQDAPLTWKAGWLPDGFVALANASDMVPGNYRGTVSYADGIASFSVFVEPLGSEAMPEGVSRTGATGAVTRHLKLSGTGMAVTVVGEIPLVTAIKVADNIHSVTVIEP